MTTRERATKAGVEFPGATLGCTGPIRPSAGGERYEAVLRRHIRQSKGRWRGKPLEPYPAQSGFNHELLRTDPHGRRIYRRAVKGVARKNGKSTDAAGLALYLLLFDDEPAPEVYSAAGSREQAKVVFQEAARMVDASPVLSEWCRVQRNEIIVPSIDGVYRAVSAEGGLQHGTNPHAVIADELHVLKGDAGRELWHALTTGMLAREQPLAVAYTTAGYDRDSLLYELYDSMLAGDDEQGLLHWTSAAEGDDWSEPATWMKANPAPWITAALLEPEFKRLPPAVFARLHLNLWTESEQLWLPTDALRAAWSDPTIYADELVWLGVDIGLRHDTSAVVEVARTIDDDGRPRYRAIGYIFQPAEQGGVLDLAPVENLIRELARKRRVVECRYDPHFFQRSAEQLSDQIRMVEFPMSNARVVPASQNLYDLFTEHRIELGGNREFLEHVRAAVVRETERGWRISKARSRRRIDALIALMLAVSGVGEPSRLAPGVRMLS